MRYTARINPIFIIFISVITPVYAGIRTQTNVNVQGDSHTTVESNTSSNSKTDIEVTVNGETKKITSDKNENISYTSDDGSINIDVQNNSNSRAATVQPTKKPEPTQVAKKEPETFVADTLVENSESTQSVEVTSFFSETISLIISILQSWI